MRIRLVLALAACLFALQARAEVIGLRFVVSQSLGVSETQRSATVKRLGEHVAELNGYFRNSGVRLRAEVMHVEFASIEKLDVLAILEDMQREREGFSDLFAKADEFGADFTLAVVGKLTIRGTPGCGRGFAVNQSVEQISSTRRAFAVVNIVCGAHTLAHELGHLMGLNHGYLVDKCEPGRGHASAIAPYANGYAEGNCDGKMQPGEFGTLMVGGWMKQVNGDGRSSLPIFSNPRIRDERCGQRGICGDEAIGDEARALNENAHHYAAHEEPDVHTLAYASAPLAACIAEKYRGIEIADLHELSCPSRGIESLGGLERLVALKRIDLSGNRLHDLSPLLNLDLRGMERINLAGSRQADCAKLLQPLEAKALSADSCRRP